MAIRIARLVATLGAATAPRTAAVAAVQTSARNVSSCAADRALSATQYNFTCLDEVAMPPVSADGAESALAARDSATNPGARSSHSISVAGDYLYALGGEVLARTPIDSRLWRRHLTVQDGPSGAPTPAAGAWEVVGRMRAAGVEPNVVTWTALVDAYSKAQVGGAGGGADPKGAWDVITAMREAGCEPNVVTWTAVMDACANARLASAGGGADVDGAWAAVQAMKQSGVPRNAMTWSTLLVACHKARVNGRPDVERAWEAIAAMRADGHEPRLLDWMLLYHTCARARASGAASVAQAVAEMKAAGLSQEEMNRCRNGFAWVHP